MAWPFGRDSKDTGQVGLSNINTPIDIKSTIRLDQSKKSQTVSNQRTSTYAPQYAPVSNKSLSLILNSPNSSSNARADALGATSTPTLIPSISQPVDLGATNATPQITPTLSLGGGGSLGTILLVGALGLGGVWLVTRGGKKK